VLEDLNSTNGVFIKSKRVKHHDLADGDVIQLGEHKLLYRDLRKTHGEKDAFEDDDPLEDDDEDEDEDEEDAKDAFEDERLEDEALEEQRRRGPRS
jgi:pSer/pThr/pTyr-binding forkhead associated (FHA) protein